MSIDLKNVCFSYNTKMSLEKFALENVSLSIGKGEFVLIGGKVGSGKSTLIKHFNGLLRPTTGSVTVEGIPAHGKKIKEKVGLLFQYPQRQLFGKTVYEDIAFGPSNFKHEGNELKKKINRALDLVGLKEDICSLSPFSLSGGQMKLVAIAGVLASEPDYLVLDEPFSGLDPDNSKLLLLTLRHLNSTGISIVIISHQVEDLLQFADKIVIMDMGKIAFIGKPDEYVRSECFPLPEITCLMKELHMRGLDVKTDIFLVEEAFYEILIALEAKGGKTK